MIRETIFIGFKIAPKWKRYFSIAAAELGINRSEFLRRAAIKYYVDLTEKDVIMDYRTKEEKEIYSLKYEI
jgi:hypothetical protein